MNQQVTFSGGTGRVTIEVLGYERATAQRHDGGDWLASIIVVETPPSTVEFKAAFTRHELSTLYTRLPGPLPSLSGIVSFQNHKEDLTLEIQFLEHGAVRISGTAKPHGSAGATLDFRFDSHQWVMGHTAEQLWSVLRQFPVRRPRSAVGRRCAGQPNHSRPLFAVH